MNKWLEMTSILDHKFRTEITFRDTVIPRYTGVLFFAFFGVWISWWLLHVEMVPSMLFSGIGAPDSLQLPSSVTH